MVYGKVPPQAKTIEEAVLGAILNIRDTYDTVAAILKPDCFYVEAHQHIFLAMQRLANKSQPIDILTVAEELRAMEKLEVVGGAYYVTQLTNSVVSSAHTQSHARIVLQKYIQREVIRVSSELIAQAYEDGADAIELLNDASNQLSAITDNMSFGEMVSIDNVLVKAIQQIEKYREENEQRKDGLMVTGVPSGFTDLDMATRGWQPGDLIIIAARPSIGKTAFALNLLKNAADYLKNHKSGSVAMWSLEMKNVRLVFRLLAAASEVWLTKLQTGKMTEEDMRQLYKNGVQKLAELQVFFDEQPGLTIQKLKTKARKLKRKNELQLIIIDYLQLMTPDENSRGNREQEISKISRELKKLAQELDVPIIALSQLSREVEKRQSGKPQLSDLRESGAIEQDADMVMFLYGSSESEIEQARQQGNYDEVKNKRFVSIAKQRDGMLVTVETNFKGDLQLFEKINTSGLGSNWKPVSEVVVGSKMTNYYEPEKEDKEDMPF